MIGQKVHGRAQFPGCAGLTSMLVNLEILTFLDQQRAADTDGSISCGLRDSSGLLTTWVLKGRIDGSMADVSKATMMCDFEGCHCERSFKENNRKPSISRR